VRRPFSPADASPQTLTLAEGEHTSKQHFLERKQALAASLKGRQGERKLGDNPYWYIDAGSDTVCPSVDGDSGTCFSGSFPRGPSLCTNAGGMIWSDDADVAIKSPFVIPSECMPSPKTTKEECTAINNLWNNKFKYCCPLFMNGDDYWGWYSTEPTSLPQYKINDPAALSTFFNRPTSTFLDYIGYPNLPAAKWVGKGNKGGCRLFFGAPHVS
jgi:hypothetical protein